MLIYCTILILYTRWLPLCNRHVWRCFALYTLREAQQFTFALQRVRLAL